MNPTNKLVAIYARVSTSKQEDEQTIKNQIDTLEELAKEKGYTIVQRYLDDGWSGDILVRPELDNLRQDVKNKYWEAVLVYDPDRLARRYSYQELVMDELKEAGVEIIFKTVSTPKNAEDKILHGVRGLFSEYERVKISERFRLGKLRKVRDGHLLVSEPLYGYSYIPKKERKHGYYEINEIEASVVRRIFDMVANEQMTLRGVVKRLQELNIKPRRSKRGVWSTSTLSTMLRNEAYIGNAHWGSTYAVVPDNPTKNEKYKKVKKSSRKTKPESEWITNSIPVPVIIDKKLFKKARKQLEDNYALCQRNVKNEYLLSKKIWCECGKTRAGEGPQKGKHLYYRCTDRVRSFPLPRKCMLGGVNARIADEMVWNKVVKLMSSPDLMTNQVERWLNNKKGSTNHIVADVSLMKKQVADLKIQEDRYNKAYSIGVYTIEDLVKYITPIKEEIMSLEGRINKINTDKNKIDTSILPDHDTIKSFAEKSKEVLQNLNFEQKKAIVLSTIDKVIATQEKLQVWGYIPIILEKHVEYQTSHRNRRSAKCRKKHII